MQSFLLVILIFVIFMLNSCASKKKDYVTQNDHLISLQKNSHLQAYNKKKDFKFIIDYEAIPKFDELVEHMAPGHLFQINHPSDEKLNGRFRADFFGKLRLPYNVQVSVKGLTFHQLKNKVLQIYSEYFQSGVRNVSFNLVYRQFYIEVRGMVKNTGRYLVSQKMGLDKIIDQAGGLKGDISKNFYQVSIKQQDTGYVMNLNQYFQTANMKNIFTWTGGDSLYFKEQDASDMKDDLPIVTTLGGVIRPGSVLYKENADIFYYISKSGGAVPALAFSESYLMRKSKDGFKKIKFSLIDSSSLPLIEPNDIILLQAQKKTSTDILFDRISQMSSVLLTFILILTL